MSKIIFYVFDPLNMSSELWENLFDGVFEYVGKISHQTEKTFLAGFLDRISTCGFFGVIDILCNCDFREK